MAMDELREMWDRLDAIIKYLQKWNGKCIESIDCRCTSCLDDCSDEMMEQSCILSVDCQCDPCLDYCLRKMDEGENHVEVLESTLEFVEKEDQLSEVVLIEEHNKLEKSFTLETEGMNNTPKAFDKMTEKKHVEMIRSTPEFDEKEYQSSEGVCFTEKYNEMTECVEVEVEAQTAEIFSVEASSKFLTPLHARGVTENKDTAVIAKKTGKSYVDLLPGDSLKLFDEMLELDVAHISCLMLGLSIADFFTYDFEKPMEETVIEFDPGGTAIDVFSFSIRKSIQSKAILTAIAQLQLVSCDMKMDFGLLLHTNKLFDEVHIAVVYLQKEDKKYQFALVIGRKGLPMLLLLYLNTYCKLLIRTLSVSPPLWTIKRYGNEWSHDSLRFNNKFDLNWKQLINGFEQLLGHLQLQQLVSISKCIAQIWEVPSSLCIQWFNSSCWHTKGVKLSQSVAIANHILKKILGNIDVDGDKFEVDRVRGITVKAQTTTIFHYLKFLGTDTRFWLNLIGTPRQVDFSYEVPRSLATCTLLVVGAAQGVQAQAVVKFYFRFESDLAIVSVINEIDQPTADLYQVKAHQQGTFKAVLKRSKMDGRLSSISLGWILVCIVTSMFDISLKDMKDPDYILMVFDPGGLDYTITCFNIEVVENEAEPMLASCLVEENIVSGDKCRRGSRAATSKSQKTEARVNDQHTKTSVEQLTNLNYCHWHWHFCGCSNVPAIFVTLRTRSISSGKDCNDLS